MFEHLAFKGTSQIGTTDYAAEKVALEKVEAANDAYEAEYLKPVGRDAKKLAELKKAFLAAQAEAREICHPQPVHRGRRGERRARFERGDRPRRHAVLLVDAGKPAGAVGVDGEQPPGRHGPARVLQGARRGDGGAPHARRLRPHRAACGAVPGHGIRGAQLRPQRDRLAQRGQPDYGHRSHGLPQEVLRWRQHRGGHRGRRGRRRPRCRCWRSISAAFPAGPSRKI